MFLIVLEKCAIAAAEQSLKKANRGAQAMMVGAVAGCSEVVISELIDKIPAVLAVASSGAATAAGVVGSGVKDAAGTVGSGASSAAGTAGSGASSAAGSVSSFVKGDAGRNRAGLGWWIGCLLLLSSSLLDINKEL
jgi:hypothetical protein